MALTTVKKAALENIVTNDANNRILTATGTSSSLNGEGNLTFDGNNLAQTIDAAGEGVKLTAAGDHYVAFVGDSNRTNDSVYCTSFSGKWNGTTIGGFNIITGADDTNKDEGELQFTTTPSGGNETERLRITSNGDAVFSSSGGNQYTFKSDSFCVLNIVADSDTNEGNTDTIIRFKHADDLKAEIRWDESANLLRMGTGDGTNNLVVDADGDVGIGTDAPSSYTNYNTLTIDGTSGGQIDIRTNGARYGDIYTAANAFHIRNKQTSGSGDIVFHTTASGTCAERARLTSAGDFHTTGNFVLAAAGKGIDFSDTSDAAGATSELLNDYEEGTFTPSNSVGITLTNNNPAYYIKIGKLVHIQMDISFSGVSDSSQVGYIQSLPFTSTGTSNHFAQGSIQHISENGGTAYDEDQNGLLMFVAPSESRIDIIVGGNGSVATRAHLEGRRFRISMFYKSAS